MTTGDRMASDATGKTALVTGAAGFIGSHVAERLVAAGHRVIGVDDLSGGFLDNVTEGVDLRRGSVEDAGFVESLWQEESVDLVFHLAAYAAEGLSHFIRRYNYRNNVLGSINLINQAVRHDCECFVFTSSIAVYGEAQTPMAEEMTPQPEDPYGIAKYAVEMDLRAAHEMFGLPYIIFRPHNVYGERQNISDPYRNVIGIFMNQVLRGEPMTVFGDGTQTRAFSHVDDVAGPIVEAPFVPEAYQQVFNVGADRPHTILRLAEEIAAAFDVEPEIRHLPARNEVVHAFASHERAEAVFGRRETVSLEEGIRRMAHWVRSQGPRKPVVFSGIEVERNLPPSWAKLTETQATESERTETDPPAVSD